ncbi:MAG TPA: ACP S-malonyltransferase [Candidatus Limnocylindria bacterium]|jgi:trans-AT polyketide synthase/acyltransferase/oxidoreductase domain-containing protein|nr:ACP S-malonyltransferase [Candidatus Limnocylindria bacterium]
MTRIVIFPGQGSQQKGMGADLFPMFPELVQIADRELGYSIVELCVEDPRQQLGQTQFTQVALYVVNALMFLRNLKQTGKLPHFLAGHSLGEYDALFAARVFDFATGLRLVKQRGALMARASGGGMAAVIGLTAEKISEALAASGFRAIDLANLNAPNQTVISGLEADLNAAIPKLEGAGAQMVKKLNVSAAFHSRYMADAQREFVKVLDTAEFQPPSIPVIANVTARPYEPDQIKSVLARQITSPVRWTETVQWLMTQPDAQFEEVGPGNVLTGLVRRIRGVPAVAVATAASTR